jgi:putative toxin-antitoxin system antitoxin component (TIGR02293 family)
MERLKTSREKEVGVAEIIAKGEPRKAQKSAGTAFRSEKARSRQWFIAKSAMSGSYKVSPFIIGDLEIANAGPEERIVLLREGFPAKSISSLAERLNWSREHAIDVLRFKRSTVLRKIKTGKRLDSSESERLLAVMDLIVQVQQIVERSGDPTGFDASTWVAGWLETPNPALGGREPVGYLDTHEGVNVVRGLIAQMESGAYA